MASFSFGDVLPVPFLFSCQNGAKQQPAAVISDSTAHSRHGDVILMAIMTVLPQAAEERAWLLSDWTAAGVLRPSPLEPFVLSPALELTVHRLGTLSPSDPIGLGTTVRRLFAHVLGAG